MGPVKDQLHVETHALGNIAQSGSSQSCNSETLLPKSGRRDCDMCCGGHNWGAHRGGSRMLFPKGCRTGLFMRDL